MVKVQCGAIFDATRQYRYSLSRNWGNHPSRATFIMLNPSTADENQDDPTIRRCMGFARNWGYSSVEIVNLFAYRATQVSNLKKALDPIGHDNDGYIESALARSNLVVCAWGNWGALWNRDRQIQEILRKATCTCLGLTQSGQPRHPLYLAQTADLVPYSPAPPRSRTKKKN